MGEKEGTMKDRRKKRELIRDTTNVAQFFEITLVLLMIFLIYTSRSPALLNVHVSYSTISWLLFMFQGILVFRQINPLIRRTLGRDTEFAHWVLETIALLGATLGFLTGYGHNTKEGKPHFISWHGLIGLMGYAFCLFAGLNGIPTLYKKELRNYISPQWNRLFHIVTGSLGLSFGGVSLFCALSSDWFKEKTTPTTYVISLFLMVSVVTWTLTGPIDKIRSIWRKLKSEA